MGFWSTWRENRRSLDYSRRSGERWPKADVPEFVAAVEASGLFESVEAAPVAPGHVDLYLEAATGQSFVVMVADGLDSCRVICDGYVFDRVPACLVLEFLRTVLAGEIDVEFSSSRRWVRLRVPLSGEGTWQESRCFDDDLAPWEARAISSARTSAP
ncbi:hypothetical protein ACIQ9P_17865 [Kitasatospora sp. NPDC094019]|uniref:hypothetical protein n=1 Tax=Kitasatospora sp. NPDC094019 TaxID=3364091 RepID=UPI00380E3A44